MQNAGLTQISIKWWDPLYFTQAKHDLADLDNPDDLPWFWAVIKDVFQIEQVFSLAQVADVHVFYSRYCPIALDHNSSSLMQPNINVA